MIKKIILIFFFLWTGREISSLAQQLPFKNYSTRDGLVHNDVRCLYQDSQGYLWIGTTEGISRYDGATFTNYILTSDSTTRYIDPLITFINTFFEDQEKNLWIGLNFWGDIARFNPVDQSFTRYTLIPRRTIGTSSVNTILQDNTGTLWFGSDEGLFVFKNGSFHAVALEGRNFPISIRVLYKDHLGTIWIGSNRGLYCYAPKTGVQQMRFPDLDVTQCNAFYEDQEDNLWIGTDNSGLLKLANHSQSVQIPAHLTQYTTANGLPSNSVHDILPDDSGSLWLATWAGLCNFRPSTEELITYTTANGLPSDNLMDILQDREGNLWLATTNGISKLTGQTFANYGKREGLPTEYLLQIIQAADDALWLVGIGGACRFFNGAFVPIEALRKQHVYSLLIDKTGAVWFGTTRGLVKWKDGRILSRYTTLNGLAGNNIYTIFQDSRGVLWFGHERGVSRWWRGRFRHLYGQEKKPLVIGMAEDKDGTLWFATYRDGVYQLRAGYGTESNWIKLDIPVGFRMRAILCDRENKIWLGTRFDGVFCYDPQTAALRHYTTVDGLSSNFVRSIFQDSRGNYWFGTARGVNRFDGTRFKPYTTREGLAGDAVFAAVEDKQGYLWFATSTGLSRYNPAQDRLVTTPPPVYITHFRILGQEVSPKNGMGLTPSQRSVSFEYVGISLKDETQVRYQYQLQGFDAKWSEITDRRYVNYTNLRPGKYLFEVRAKNVDGVWSVQPATFSFRIATPLWRRGWFIGLTIMAIGGIAFGLHRYRLNKLLELERMRSRIATDLHDEVGSTLSSLALFSEIARREVRAIAPKVAERLQNISEIAGELMETIRDIVWSIDPSRDTLEDVVLYMKQYAAEVLEARGIQFTFDVHEETKTLRLLMDVRHHLYLIFKETINNMVRHSGADQANIRLGFDHHMLILVIQDNGRGFDPTRIGRGNGLKNMKNRARLINGELNIISAPGNGTEIVLKLPLQK